VGLQIPKAFPKASIPYKGRACRDQPFQHAEITTPLSHSLDAMDDTAKLCRFGEEALKTCLNLLQSNQK
jgi:hypothetical protein